MLAAEALGASNVPAVLMPDKSSHQDSQAHAEMIVRMSGIESICVDITRQIDAYFDLFRMPMRAGVATRWRASA